MAKKGVFFFMLLFFMGLATTRLGSSFVFPLEGNAYPDGFYYASVVIGGKNYSLDIDTGSDLTWVECKDSDQSCIGCTQPPESHYETKNNYVPVEDPLCHAIESQGTDGRCDYVVKYAGKSQSSGVLVNDDYRLKSRMGSVPTSLIFGCTTKISSSDSSTAAGILALGKGNVSIVSQLRNMSLTRNVIGHCLGRPGGYLFIGDNLLSSLKITWTPMSYNSEGHYSAGPVKLLFGENFTALKEVIFDSGSSYTHFIGEVYESIVDVVRRDLKGKPLADAPDGSGGDFSTCWKGPKPFIYIDDVKEYFKPLALSFTQANNVELQLKPEDYLIVTKEGNVCLGIFNGSEEGLGNLNIIGDISMQDKMVIYDNDNQRIGWVPADCARVPYVDDDNYKDEL